jgi:sugar phosphate isomerase/epimerase
MLAETMRRCGDTGVVVLDVEAIKLGPGPGLAGCEAVLETAAVLGARYLNVICEDPDTARFADRLAELVQIARPYRVRPVIEFMAWRPLRTLADAVAIATGSGGAGLLLDTLHI